ncbi:MAG: AbrB/MazE/SpoVT family DNA-binding domain-containing protein [Promethearchaeota archaeon]
MLSHKIKLNERGTLTIPVDIRKELNLNKNSSFQIINDDGIIKLIPIYDLTKDHNWIKKNTFSEEALDEAHLIDLKVEKQI